MPRVDSAEESALGAFFLKKTDVDDRGGRE